MQYYQLDKHPIEFVLSENIEKHFSSHNHVGHYVVSLVVQGEVEVFLENKRIEYTKGNLFIIPPYTLHSIYQNKNVRLLSMCIGTSFIEENTLDLAVNIIQDFIKNLCEKEIIDFTDAKSLLNSIQTIYYFYEKNRKKLDEDISILADKIVSHPELELTINTLAGDIFVSKYYLIRKFKNCIGMTPHQFHIQNRIRKSQHLLDDEKTIVEISVAMGFYDQSHFNKTFQKIVGISPLEYIHSRKDMRLYT
ncbi:MAG: AraC family transcriptional regulator [Clostridium sp.]|nr:AraC family transcriptional regulator [Clostridium sp.]